MTGAANTSSQFRVLYRQFLFRVVDLEVLSASALGDANKLLGRFAALLIVIGAGFGFGPLFIDFKDIPPHGLLDFSLNIQYQLIAMTMLVVGIFAVLSWDSIFPDRRDVFVLAPLPVSARGMFLAKVAATGTALSLVVVLLHSLAGLSWPFTFSLVAPTNHVFLGVVRWFAAYWFTMFAAGLFIYCSVLAFQGLAAQLLPRRLFLRASGFLQMAAFCLFVSTYFLEPSVDGLSMLTAPENHKTLLAVPTYWFFALLGPLGGSMHPELAPLARRAWVGLGIAAGAAALAYALSYVRTIRQIVEEPDITSAKRTFRWLPRLGNSVQTAIGQFAVRTLSRSRQHRLIFAFYLGIGLAFTMPMLSPLADSQLSIGRVISIWRHANAPLLAATVMMLTLAALGMRAVFAFPLELRANWIFRTVGLRDTGKILVAVRRTLVLLSVAPVCLISAVICFWLWPWWQAAAHVVVLGLLGLILADLVLLNVRKIPFTCSYLPGKSQVHLIVCAVVVLISLVAQSVIWEQQALQKPWTTIVMLIVIGATAAGIHWYTTVLARAEQEELQFEEEAVPAVMELGLYRDGVMTRNPP